MARIYKFSDGMPEVDPMPLPELAQQPVPPVIINPNARRSVPAKAIIDSIMRDRSSFIADLAERTEVLNG